MISIDFSCLAALGEANGVKWSMPMLPMLLELPKPQSQHRSVRGRTLHNETLHPVQPKKS